MKVVEFSSSQAQPIELFNSVSTASLPLGDGRGETHVHCVFFDAGGKIGEHPTGFAQLFLVIEGSGWAMGADGVRVELRAGQGVYFERGENHSKGSETGMTAIMVQVSEMESR
jgi:quercetin dioxygenase-like cupin family protein